VGGDDRGSLSSRSRQKNGLYSVSIYFVGADERGGMWVGTERGVHRFNGETWQYFDQAHGLVWNDCTKTRSSLIRAAVSGSAPAKDSRSTNPYLNRYQIKRRTWSLHPLAGDLIL
jgi:hypothetical protein